MPCRSPIALATGGLLLGVCIVLSACGSSDQIGFSGTAYPNGDPENTRFSEGPIDSSTVSELETAWTVPLTAESAYGAFSSSPVVSEGAIYAQDLSSNVLAIDLDSGEVLWRKKYELLDLGPNGVTVADGRVYGATPVAAFALDQETGKQLWSTTLTESPVEGVDMAPGYEDGMVFVSTVPATETSSYNGGGVGVLWALDAKTGKKLWHFDTVPKNLWGKPKVNSGGGLWYTPAFDGGGSMYFGVGNPGPLVGAKGEPFGSSRPGRNLYTDSIVKMDTETGKMDWYYQLTPHDIYDWDLQGPPILMNVGGRKLVVAAGKSGFVIALDAKTGKLAWKRPVGKHNGHDRDGLLAMRGETSKLKPPYEIYPGNVGGVISPMSTDGSTIFAPVIDHPVTVTSGSEFQETKSFNMSTLVALNPSNGTVKWEKQFSSEPVFGATTAVNDVVFTTTYDGAVYAFDASNGEELWRDKLPANTNTGVTAVDDTVIAPAGEALEPKQKARIVAYRLGG
jgi:outer membrane protein assembly factor BamB